jgi:hypothetical protein
VVGSAWGRGEGEGGERGAYWYPDVIYKYTNDGGRGRGRSLGPLCSPLGSLAFSIAGGAILQPLQAIGSIGFGFESQVPVEETVVLESGALEKVAEYSLEVSAVGGREGGRGRAESDQRRMVADL